MLNRWFVPFLVAALGVAPLAGASADPTQAATPVGTHLLMFERAVKWEVVSKKWVAMRDGWMSDVASAENPADLAEATLALESHMDWSSVEAAWKKRRASWVEDVKRTSTMREAAMLLLELEANTLWSAVQTAWKDHRETWVRGLTRVAEGGGVSKSGGKTRID
jgi:hypothetical protein